MMKKKCNIKINLETVLCVADIVALTGGILGLIFGNKKMKVASAVMCVLSLVGGFLIAANKLKLFSKKPAIDLSLNFDGCDCEDGDCGEDEDGESDILTENSGAEEFGDCTAQ